MKAQTLTKAPADWRCTRNTPNLVAHLVKATEGDKVQFVCDDWQQALYLSRCIKGARKCSSCLAEGGKKK
jgi:hypothetical protein